MDDIVRCSFCNKTQAQVRKLIAGPNGTYISVMSASGSVRRSSRKNWIMTTEQP